MAILKNGREMEFVFVLKNERVFITHLKVLVHIRPIIRSDMRQLETIALNSKLSRFQGESGIKKWNPTQLVCVSLCTMIQH